ncbi:bifunctional protein FolD [Agaricicola taiwanensis]|uniref:Bifunctional protein FolD n=1 Tax=Agaricicola taiwanensis TaxID=591372 RepID=A0A8J2VK69_9RHOB|nr:bifunctional methylenetetrahydrofolate dehydrogenase/methenyltetrahydrofolate cyclohydrolase FolD [Agaricicola taiwanensis]GGE27868.1 bifunctional protein FolD [Agaricicola taiwanensis]
MSATIIDGKAIAETVRGEAADRAAALEAATGVKPGLAVVLVGNDPASEVYVRNKARLTVAAGMASFEHKLRANTSEADLIALVERLNADPLVHGILVQMPLPGHIDSDRVVLAIDPAKDVDGLTPANAGRLVLGRGGLVPCTPQGCIILAKHALGPDLAGKEALVIGRSILVGKPVALLLQAESCTVTMAHSKTHDLAGHCRRADILVAAVGRPEMVKGDWIKPGAVVIDVGINRIAQEGGKTRLVGDVAYEEAREVAGAITPVPGGVGPMTIACLLQNTVTAAEAQVRPGA